MAVALKIDFVSDVVCPWCVIGLRGLETALERMGDTVEADIRLHPFELNPDMPPEGEDIAEHIARKYGASAEQSKRNSDAMRDRAAALGFVMNRPGGGRIRNSFDAHRLLHWAGLEGRASALQHALFAAYFTDGCDIADRDVLIAAAKAAGLDGETAGAHLANGTYADAVRGEESHWRGEGVTAVPTIVVNDRYVITGGQEPAAFERALGRIAAELAST